MKKVIMILLLGVIGLCTLTSCNDVKGYLESLYNEADNFFNGGSKASTSSSSNIPVPSSSSSSGSSTSSSSSGSSSSSSSSSSEVERFIDDFTIELYDEKMKLAHTAFSVYQIDDVIYLDDIEINYEKRYYDFFKNQLSVPQESWIASILNDATITLYSENQILDKKRYQTYFDYFSTGNAFDVIKYTYYDDCLVFSHTYNALGYPYSLQFNIIVYPV